MATTLSRPSVSSISHLCRVRPPPRRCARSLLWLTPHASSGTNKYVRALTNYGQLGRAQIIFFAGTVACSVANALLTITIAEDETAVAAPESA